MGNKASVSVKPKAGRLAPRGNQVFRPLRVSACVPASRAAAHQPSQPIEEGLQAERSLDTFSRPKRSQLFSVGFFVERVSEAPGSAREERRRVHESVVAPLEMRSQRWTTASPERARQAAPSHRIERDVARRRHQMVLVHDNRAEARLEQMSSHPRPRIDKGA